MMLDRSKFDPEVQNLPAYELSAFSNIYKNTYKELAYWVKQLLKDNSILADKLDRYILQVRRAATVESLNYQQAAAIMELEFRITMMEKEYGVVDSNVVTNEQLQEHRRKYHLGLKTSDGGPSDMDWLSRMKVGTEFLVRPKAQETWMLVKFMQAGCKDGNVLVIPMKGEEVTAPESEWLWADPVAFCKFWELRGIVLIPKEEDE